MDEKAALLERLHQEKHASDADWENRLKEAVDSAEQWKEFAEKLGREKADLEFQAQRLHHSLEVNLQANCAVNEHYDERGGDQMSYMQMSMYGTVSFHRALKLKSSPFF